MRALLTPHIEHYTIGLSRELSKLVKITLLTTKRFNTQANQIVVPNLPIPYFKGLMRKIIFKLFGGVYDIIHVNTSQDGLFAGNFDKLLVTEHGWPDPKIVEETERGYYLKEQSALLKLYEMGVPIVTVSNYSAEMLRKLYGIKAHKVIYHGLLENFISKPKAAPMKHKILYVSRLVSAKEPFVLLKALSRICNKLDFKAIIRGDGPLLDIVKRYVHQNNLDSCIHILGKVPFSKLPNLYKSHTIFVHTCSREPFGIAVLEAMGCGLPVIVPKEGGSLEVAGDAALTFKSGDYEDLSEKLLSICNDASLYEKLSKKSIIKNILFIIPIIYLNILWRIFLSLLLRVFLP